VLSEEFQQNYMLIINIRNLELRLKSPHTCRVIAKTISQYWQHRVLLCW